MHREITDRAVMEQVIGGARVCSVAMVTPEGEPYLLPMNFGYHDGLFYLHSGREGRKYEVLQRCPKVALMITTEGALVCQHPDVACSYSMESISVLAEGEVEFIDDYEAKVDLLNILMRHYTQRDFTYSTPAVNNVLIWRLSPRRITCRAFGERRQRVSPLTTNTPR